jgi:HAE1 family hydrophobic/amphiphilic exporter-1
MVIILSLVLVFGVMAAQYESFRDPFINFCTIPLLLIGVVLIHIFSGEPLTAFSLIGIVINGGMVSASVITLIFIPVLYSLFHTNDKIATEEEE